MGRFLEHSRIYYFRNGGEEEIYLGSADLMPRNLDRRVEVLFPVLDRKLMRHLRDVVLEKMLEDDRQDANGRPGWRLRFLAVAGRRRSRGAGLVCAASRRRRELAWRIPGADRFHDFGYDGVAELAIGLSVGDNLRARFGILEAHEPCALARSQAPRRPGVLGHQNLRPSL